MTFPRDESKAARAAGIELRLSECDESLETRDNESACRERFSYFSSGANTRTLRAFACNSTLGFVSVLFHKKSVCFNVKRCFSFDVDEAAGGESIQSRFGERRKLFRFANIIPVRISYGTM